MDSWCLYQFYLPHLPNNMTKYSSGNYDFNFWVSSEARPHHIITYGPRGAILQETQGRSLNFRAITKEDSNLLLGRGWILLFDRLQRSYPCQILVRTLQLVFLIGMGTPSSEFWGSHGIKVWGRLIISAGTMVAFPSHFGIISQVQLFRVYTLNGIVYHLWEPSL